MHFSKQFLILDGFKKLLKLKPIWEIWVFVLTREKVRVEIYSIPGKLLLKWE
jgi:hypothetical protein